MANDLCYELHPGEDLFDGSSFKRFLEAVNHHPRANILYDPSHMLLQGMDYLGFIDCYHSRIKAFHVKDAEFRPSASQGVYSGYANWVDRAGRFCSLGDRQIDFVQIFSKLSQYGYNGWAVLEWESCLKDSKQFITKWHQRIVSLHVKDNSGVGVHDDERNFTVAGKGIMSWDDILRSAQKSQIQWFIVPEFNSELRHSPTSSCQRIKYNDRLLEP